MRPAGAGQGNMRSIPAMNQDMGVTTLLLPANPVLAAVSSTVLREFGT
jgi:hypothetical protein